MVKANVSMGFPYALCVLLRISTFTRYCVSPHFRVNEKVMVGALPTMTLMI